MSSERSQEAPRPILHVEDNPAHATLVARCFEKHPIANKIFHVADGQSALDYLFRRGDYIDAEKSPRPHLILFDLRLPDRDGLEVIHEIKTSKELQAIPLVVLSSSEAPPDVEAAYRGQVNSYLVKPPNFETFQRLMTALGFYWLSWNHYHGTKEHS